MKNKLGKKLTSIILGVLVVILIILFIFFTLKDARKHNAVTEAITDSIEEGVEDDNEPSHADLLDEESLIEDEGEEIFYISKDEVDSFAITDANGIYLEFNKSGDQWVCVDYEDLDIKESRVDKMLNYLCDIRYIEAIDVDDASQYDLSQDSIQFLVNEKGGNSIYISLGRIEEDGSIYFALNYDFNKIFKNSGKLKKISEYAIEDLIAV